MISKGGNKMQQYNKSLFGRWVRLLGCVGAVFVCAYAYGEDIDLTQQQINEKQELVRELKDEIQQIDSEMARCQKAKKGWTAATVVGGVGVAATGGAAIAQVVKAKKDEKQKSVAGGAGTAEKQESNKK